MGGNINQHQEGKEKGMKLVFISHVADSDKHVACLFEDWLRVASKSQADVFVSSTDGILPGQFADETILSKLRDADVLVILLSPSANGNPWLAFEAGAFFGLKKPVIPIACRGAKPADFDGPLKQPQMSDAADPIQFSTAMAALGEAIKIHFVRDYNELRKCLCTPVVPQINQHAIRDGGFFVCNDDDGGINPNEDSHPGG